jgi:antitoxin component YwqK of YwqJK toxin-antitoxin module
MINRLFIVTMVLLFGCSGRNIKETNYILFQDLEFKEGKAYSNEVLFTGKVRTLHDNGSVHMETDFKDGLDDGIFIELDSAGNLIEKSEVSNGKLIGNRTRFNSNGVKTFDGNYSDGLRNGKVTEWRSDGTIFLIRNYKNDLEEGLYELYDEEGVLRLRGLMRLGNRDSIWIEYRDSVIVYEHFYDNGELIRSMQKS